MPLSLDQSVWVRAVAVGYRDVLLGKTMYLHSAPLHPGVQMGSIELNAGGNLVMD